MRKLPPGLPARIRGGRAHRLGDARRRGTGAHARAISRHLKLLADDVGAELFERDGTGLRMTPAAADFYAVTRSVFDQLERAYDNLGSRAAGPGVHVACSATFAMRWLVPQLAVFYRKHPDIRIRLSMTSAREIRNEGADVLVAWDMSSYSDADQRRALPLAPVNFAAVCVPACARLAAAKRTRIAHGYTSSAWDQWEAKTGKSVARGDVLEFPHTHLCVRRRCPAWESPWWKRD